MLLATAPLGAEPLASHCVPLTGWIRTASGNPIAGTRVCITVRPENMAAICARSGRDGHFSIPDIVPGNQATTFALPGRPKPISQVVDVAGRPIRIVVSVPDTLVVTPLNPAESELPLNRRDFSTRLLLAVENMTDVNGSINFTEQFAINGQRGVEAVFAMDGADITDPEMSGSTFTNFNIDAIQ